MNSSALIFQNNIYTRNPIGKRLFKEKITLDQHLAAGNWHQAALVYRSMFMKTNKYPNFALRSYLMNGFTSILTQQCTGHATDKDLKLLKSIINGNYSDSLQIRISASCVRGVMLWQANKRDSAVRSYQLCLELCAKVTEEDEEMKIFNGMEPNGFFSGKETIEFYKNQAIDNLNKLNVTTNPTNVPGGGVFFSSIPSSTTTNTTATSDSMRSGYNCMDYEDGVRVLMNSTKITAEDRKLVEYRLNPAAKICSNITMANCSSSSTELMLCSTCKHVYYCSRACQHSHWKDHKYLCRANGKFKIGDTVLIQNLKSRIDLNGIVGTLIEGLMEGRCSLKLDDGSDTIIKIKPDNIIFLRGKRKGPIKKK